MELVIFNPPPSRTQIMFRFLKVGHIALRKVVPRACITFCHPGQVTVASPPIATKIARLTVDDNHFHYPASFKILSSFPNVDEYRIHCDVESQMFRACRDWARENSVIWRLFLVWGENVTFDVLCDFRHVTHLTIDNRSGVPLDLEKLRGFVSFELRHLRIIGPNVDPPLSIAPLAHCIQPDQFDQCLRFPNLEEFYVIVRDGISREAFTRELRDKLWPKKLKKVVLEVWQKTPGVDARCRRSTTVEKSDLHFRKSDMIEEFEV